MSDFFNGMQIITSPHLIVRRQRSRSPSRAKRRAKRGFPQHFADFPNPKIMQVGGTFYMHPATYQAFKQELANRKGGAS